jgi:hypothetical protein
MSQDSTSGTSRPTKSPGHGHLLAVAVRDLLASRHESPKVARRQPSSASRYVEFRLPTGVERAAEAADPGLGAAFRGRTLIQLIR